VARRAYLAIALGVAAIVAWGFWPSYFRPLLRGGVERPGIVHVHAAIFVGWLVLLVAQASLISVGRVRFHRRVGQAGMLYGVLVLCVGLVVSVAAPVLRVRAEQLPLDAAGLVVLYNLTDMLLFGGFFVAAMAHRGSPELHKRLILSATVALLGAAVGRVLPMSFAYLVVWLSPLFAVIAVDLSTTRRIHPVPLLSVAVFVIAFFKVDLLALFSLPREVGRVLLTPFV